MGEGAVGMILYSEQHGRLRSCLGVCFNTEASKKSLDSLDTVPKEK